MFDPLPRADSHVRHGAARGRGIGVWLKRGHATDRSPAAGSARASDHGQGGSEETPQERAIPDFGGEAAGAASSTGPLRTR